MIVYVLATNQGDGSAGIQFFRNKPDLEQLQEDDLETYGMNDYVKSFEIPDGPNTIDFVD